MSSDEDAGVDIEEDAVYILQADDDEEWVNPKPIRTAIVETLAAEIGLDVTSEQLENAVDLAAIRTVVEGERTDISFSIEGHDVTVSEDGSIEIS